MSASSATFTVGSSDLNSGVTYNVDQIIMHQDYNYWLLYNDIALLIFKGDNAIIYSDVVGPIPIQTEDIGGDVPCTLTGWGSTQVSIFLYYYIITVLFYNLPLVPFPISWILIHFLY